MMPLTVRALFEVLEAASWPIVVPQATGQSREVARVRPIADTEIRTLWPPWSSDPFALPSRALWDLQWEGGLWCGDAASAKGAARLERVEPRLIRHEP